MQTVRPRSGRTACLELPAGRDIGGAEPSSRTDDSVAIRTVCVSRSVELRKARVPRRELLPAERADAKLWIWPPCNGHHSRPPRLGLPNLFLDCICARDDSFSVLHPNGVPAGRFSDWIRAMPDANQVYVSAHGGWSVSPWQEESFQIGWRLGVFPAASVPARGELAELEPFPVVNDFSSGSTTHFTRASGWQGDPLAVLEPVGTLAQQDALAESVWTFLNSLKGVETSYARWTHVKIAASKLPGQPAVTSSVYTMGSPLVGANVAKMTAPELACALTLRAPIVGRRGRGRVYVPALSTDQNDATNGTVLGTTLTSMRGWLATLVAAFDGLVFTEGLYAARTVVTSAGKDTAVIPTEVRTGSHWDVQRRRQQEVAETYGTTFLT